MLVSPHINENSLHRPMFPKKEYDNRINKLIIKIKENSLDYVVLFSPDLLCYFTGFTGWSFYVPQFLIIGKNIEDTKLMIRHMDSPAGNSTTYLRNKVFYYPDNYVDNHILNPIQLLSKFIEKDCKLGLELNSMYSKATYKDEFLKITQSITDITYMANLIRITKTPHEVEYIKKAATIADKAMDRAINTIKSGIKASTIASEILSVQAEHGTFTSIAPMIMVDELAAHMNWCSEKLKINNMVRVEIAGAYNHYHCPIARTIFVGDKEDLENSKYADICKLESALKEGMDEILKILKVGAVSGDIYDIFNRTIGKYNLFKESRIGYSFGLGFPPDWGENTISVRNGDTTVIQENMCLHFILGCGDEWEYEYSEALLVTKNGPELLCKTPRMLFLRK